MSTIDDRMEEIQMEEDIENLFKDFNNDDLPKNLDNLDKIKCSLRIGKRIYFYYKDEKDFFENEELKIKDHLRDINSGIIVPKHGIENNGGEFDFENVMICIDQYPIEKSYPYICWIALNRLLDDKELIEIFEAE